jgi:uncharacterized membrane protein YhhN
VNSGSTFFLALAAVMAVVDWVAVAWDDKRLEYVSKPAATALLLGVAATIDVPHSAPWAWLIAALVFCLLGDVFLMLPRDAFIPGLASFAVAQVMFSISFVTQGIEVARLLGGLVVAVVAATMLGHRFVGALRRQGSRELVVPVVAYLIVISAMAVAAVGGGSVVAILGAASFMVSDSLIAESRFVKSRRWHSVGIMVTYHVALAGLVLGLL